MTHNTTAPALLGLPGDGQWLAFGKAMATAAATKIMPPAYGQKAVAPSGAVVVPQQFTADPARNRHRALIDSELKSQNPVVAPAARTILSLTQLSCA
jgi:hypothetical protein